MNEVGNFDLQVFINNEDDSFRLSMHNLKLHFVTSFNTYTSVRLEERPAGKEGRHGTQKNVRE